MYSEIQLKTLLDRFIDRCSPPADGRLDLLLAAARSRPLARGWGHSFLAFCQVLIEAEQVPPGNLRGLACHHILCSGVRSY